MCVCVSREEWKFTLKALFCAVHTKSHTASASFCRTLQGKLCTLAQLYRALFYNYFHDCSIIIFVAHTLLHTDTQS